MIVCELTDKDDDWLDGSSDREEGPNQFLAFPHPFTRQAARAYVDQMTPIINP